MLIDTHAHLDDKCYQDDLDTIIDRSKKILKYILNVGIDLDTSFKSIELAQKYNNFIFAAIGVHPHDATKYNDETEKMFEKLVDENKSILAIGEIGLDYYRNISPMLIQKDVFRKQLRLAKRLGKPVIIHNRDADDDAYSIIKEEKINNGVFHFYAGNLDLALKLIDMGFYLSFGGVVTFPKSDRLKIIENIPIDRLLLETDSPYVAPHPYRGKRNEPINLLNIAYKIAEHLNISFQDIARITTKNAIKLFKFEEYQYYQTTVYKYGKGIYINLTNRCTNNCTFCIRNITEGVTNDSLWLDHEPDFQEVMTDLENIIKNYPDINEIIFCGYGEPTIRLDLMVNIAKAIKNFWPNKIIRLNTNGLGNKFNKKNIIPELSNCIDKISISLNAENSEIYAKICPNIYGENAYNYILEFIEEAKKGIKNIQLSVVRNNAINVEKCKEIAEKFGVELRIR